MSATATTTTRQIVSTSRGHVERYAIPMPCSLISLHDPDCLPARLFSCENVARRLNLAFHDLDGPAEPLVMPTLSQAVECLGFADGDGTGLVVCQCDAGTGRSQATAAALLNVAGQFALADRVISQGTYNRPWYRLLMGAAGLEIPREPLVSVVVRLKYPPDRARALLHSLDRQRWDNWEAVLVTDGPEDPDVLYWARREVRCLYTEKRLGRWGHPYRQLGIDAARGEWICLANDDNYYVPGFLEQMVGAGTREGADLVICDMLHRYHSWNVTRSSLDGPEISTDVAAWMARADLVKSTPWPGSEFTSDGEYVAALAAKAKRVAHVQRPLVVKN